ncbi:ribokinase [Metabacillus idriensis]|uniref:Ribokinase n=1 Tax=Metabacillus idriensis TaxID=324768 RepID=A0A6I2M6N3_9BACI|nr:ribokinase [Metabacillus idriensis]MCM3595709.1 ribokinase [Metabacillus idriensis]MRX53820.1 ribokinase [Metabacillus idriensis]
MITPRITVVGSINMDLVTTASSFPIQGETIKGSKFKTFPGGKGANQAVAASRLGANVTLIGCVGSDDFGKELKDRLLNENIQVDHLNVIEGSSTGIASITVSNQDNSIIIVPGANDLLSPEMISEKEEVIAESDLLLLQLEIPLSSVIKAAELAKKHSVKILLNPAPIEKLPDSLLEMADYLTPNEHEMTYFKNNKPIQKKMIVTHGSKGVIFTENGEQKCIEAHRVKVVDTTGAGDTFNGALAVSLSIGDSLEQACRFGNAAAALSVTKFGAQGGMPFIEEVKKILLNNRPD